ncbi:hypothetical protein [Amycolatopsis sp. NPDC057786]|uniref:hypothetical protein n=1 Tax=Amycolatopsis sp. NPDC057786 TaxID=3346250 RepID=UPI00366C0A93
MASAWVIFSFEKPRSFREPAGQTARPHCRAVRFDLVFRQKIAVALFVGDAVFACRGGRSQRRRAGVADLAGEDALEHRIQFGVDLAGAGQNGFHLHLHQHAGEKPTGVFRLDDLAVVDPETVLGGEILGRLDTAHQIAHRLLGVVDDLHGRGQARREILEFLTAGAQILGRRVRRLTGPPGGFGAVDLVLQTEHLAVLCGQVVTDLPYSVSLPLADIGPGDHHRPPVPSNSCSPAPSRTRYAVAAVVSDAA